MKKETFSGQARLIKFMYALSPLACNRIALMHARFKESRNRQRRQLEIGPGANIINGFERLNIRQDGCSHYIGNAADIRLFRANEFDYIYASHVLEHIPWFKAHDALTNWYKILKPGGKLDIWIPDGYKIAKAYIEAIEKDSSDYKLDGWYKFNPSECHSVWFNGRIFSYGDGTPNPNSPNWHRASYDRDMLSNLLLNAGYKNITMLNHEEILGYDHGWINLGIRGYK